MHLCWTDTILAGVAIVTVTTSATETPAVEAGPAIVTSRPTASRATCSRDLDLPRGRERRLVQERDRIYEINGAESRMLATVGAFRVVSESDLHDGRDESRDAQKALRHLERQGLMGTSPLSSDDRAVVLADRGRDLLEANRPSATNAQGSPARPSTRA